MSRDESRDHLDEVIDRAARSLTGGEPSAGLRERVRSRIDGPRTGWHASRWGAAVAMAAVVVLAVSALAHMLLDDRSRTAIATDRPQPIQPGAQPPANADSGRADEAPRPRIPARSVSARNALAEAAWSPGFQVAPADEPAAPPFPPLSVDQVAIEPLAASPVAIEEVHVPMPLQVQRLDIVALAME